MQKHFRFETMVMSDEEGRAETCETTPGRVVNAGCVVVCCDTMWCTILRGIGRNKKHVVIQWDDEGMNSVNRQGRWEWSVTL